MAKRVADKGGSGDSNADGSAIENKKRKKFQEEEQRPKKKGKTDKLNEAHQTIEEAAGGQDSSLVTKATKKKKVLKRKGVTQKDDLGAHQIHSGGTNVEEDDDGGKRKTKADRLDEPPDLAEEETGGLSSLMKLRALLTPSGFGDAAFADEGHKQADNKETTVSKTGETLRKAGPDWTSRYYVVNPSDPHVPLENMPIRLHPAVEEALRNSGFRKLFPIQAAVIPVVSRGVQAAYDEDSPFNCDVCVAAPTGQGKTLAYAVPIVQALIRTRCAKPRALVILPVRDLAQQVFRVFQMLRVGLNKSVSSFRVCLCAGLESLHAEKAALRAHVPDILVCTPGRLVDHTKGRDSQIDLTCLRWFVIDEADRLLVNSLQSWLGLMEEIRMTNESRPAVSVPFPRMQKLLLSATMTWDPQKLAMLKLHRPLYYFSSETGKHSTPQELHQYTVGCKREAKAIAILHILSLAIDGNLSHSDGDVQGRTIVFCPSVAIAHRLTRILQILCLMPELIKYGIEFLGEEQTKEDGPSESQVKDVGTDEGQNGKGGGEGQAEEKDAIEGEAKEGDANEGQGQERIPLIPEALRFPGAVSEFTSSLDTKKRKLVLKLFRAGKVKCLVCSDVAARGLDFPNVQAVINFMPPQHIQSYIHRVGRTARAGRTGHTFTFLQRQERPHFFEMLRESADCAERIQRFPLPQEAKHPYHSWFTKAVQILDDCTALESTGDIRGDQRLTSRSILQSQGLDLPQVTINDDESKHQQTPTGAATQKSDTGNKEQGESRDLMPSGDSHAQQTMLSFLSDIRAGR